MRKQTELYAYSSVGSGGSLQELKKTEVNSEEFDNKQNRAEEEVGCVQLTETRSTKDGMESDVLGKQ